MRLTKITKKGQITIPAEYRKKLKADYYIIELKNNELIIKPFNSPAGSLKKYAFKEKSTEEVLNKEEKVLGETFFEKHKNS